MLDTALAVCAAAWGVVMALSPLLQIRRMITQRSSRDISIGYLCVARRLRAWAATGGDCHLALILPNAVAFGVGCLTVGVAIRYRPPPGRRRQSGSPDEADVP